MGPRQKCLGNVSSAAGSARDAVLQWGRDKNVSEIICAACNRITPRDRFNGAETKMSRKSYSGGVERLLELGFNGAETKMSRKSRVGGNHECMGDASMGPRQKCLGN